ncbi:Calx-beta domain-containing protein [Kribbella flavida]|nr:Calx-beta domain-containing protein [Kribbella flavida]
MVALLGGAWAAPAALAAPPAPPQSVAQGKNWTVDPVAGGYRVTLRLDRPAPLRDALPLLAVDGRTVGVARQSADRRSVSLISQDPAVLRARTVALVWSGDPAPGSKRSMAAPGPTDADWLKAPQGTALGDDPGAKGRYQVETAEYDLGAEATYLPGLGQKAELVGKVYSPRHATGPRPLVVFLHGRHQFCYGGDESEPFPTKPWPCTGSWKPVPSYRGYDGPAEALASHGYQVVSISANAVNAYDGDAYDAGAQARAELVLDHLSLWKKWSTVGGGPFGTKFVGKVNLRNVGLMGHSRGGEGVARAAVLNADRGGRYGIRAVLPLAPTDFARATVPGVAMSVVLPYCDGDVSDLQGQKFYDDTRYSVAGDNAPRSTVTVLGANHNYFNTEWTPGQSTAPANDDWWGEPGDSPCGEKYQGRLTAKEQQAVGTAYVAGFFRLQLGHEKQLLPLLDGSSTRAASAGRAVVRVVAQAPAADRRDLSRLDQPLPAGAVSGSAKTTICSANCAGTTTDGAQSPHWIEAYFAAKTPTLAVTKLSWTGKNGVLRVPVAAGQRDIRRYAALTFRAAPDPDGAPRTDLSVRVVDGHGRAVSVPASALGDALVRLPGANGSGVPKNLLRTVRLPITALKGIDLRDVRTVELRTDRVARGSVLLSDLSFSRPGVGTSGPASLLPKLSASSVKVREGDTGTQYVDFWVSMSRPSIRPVSVYAETNGELGSVVGEVARQVVFKPGQTRQKITVPIKANTRDSFDLRFSLVLSVPRDGLLKQSFGHGLVIDDDPTPKVTVGPATAVEGAEFLEFPITLAAPSDQYVSINGELKDGSATLGKDFESGYEAPPVRWVDGYVEPGRTKGVLQVRIVDDKVKEPTESFTAQLTSIEGGELDLPSTVIGTIRDDD